MQKVEIMNKKIYELYAWIIAARPMSRIQIQTEAYSKEGMGSDPTPFCLYPMSQSSMVNTDIVGSAIQIILTAYYAE